MWPNENRKICMIYYKHMLPWLDPLLYVQIRRNLSRLQGNNC